MKISGFTMVRNAGKYYFPVKEAIESALPIVDEFIVALGDCDDDDDTLEQIESIGSEKVKIYHRTWNEDHFIDGKIFRVETDFAMSKCTGDWCLYLQADEVLHEDDYENITSACLDNLDRNEVDGLLVKYYHFWGDYKHHLPYHGWCRKEFRIVKNNRGIYSYKDALSFRKPTDEKLMGAVIDATIFHYGYVRPPGIMRKKKKEQDGMHLGKSKAGVLYKTINLDFDYGPLGRIPEFMRNHPAVMKNWMQKLDWTDDLNYSKNRKHPKRNESLAARPKFKHEKLHYRLLSRLENLFDTEIFSFKNYKLTK